MQVTPIEIGKLKGRYVVFWHERDPNGQLTRKRFRLKAKTKAEAWPEGQQRYEAQLALRGFKLTLKDIWERYTVYLEGRKTAKDLVHIWQYIGPELGAYHPLQIDDELVKKYLEKRIELFQRTHGRNPAKATVFQEINLLQCVLNHAFDKNLIDKPVRLKKPPRSERRTRYLETDEIEKLLEASRPARHIYVAIAVMLSTAGRIGAVLELTWDRVDLDKRTIDLRVGGSSHRKNRAFIPINDGLLKTLIEWKKECDSEFVVEYQGVGVTTIKKGFNNAVEGAELNKPGLEKVTPHVLRHTAAVHMAANGRPMAKISQYMGHTSIATTERHYARFSPKHLQEEAEALDFIKS